MGGEKHSRKFVADANFICGKVHMTAGVLREKTKICSV